MDIVSGTLGKAYGLVGGYIASTGMCVMYFYFVPCNCIVMLCYEL